MILSFWIKGSAYFSIIHFLVSIIFLNGRDLLINMSSSELIMCDECGQRFDTIESLKEHQITERQEKGLRNRGIDDG